MPDEILSPIALWKDYDPEALPLESDFLGETRAAGVVCRRIYFTALTTEQGGKIRAYAELRYTEEAYERTNGYLPAVVVAGDMYDSDVGRTANALVHHGYAVALCDIEGDRALGRCTIYPNELGYCQLSAARRNLYDAVSPRSTPWYAWTAIFRRMVTQLRAFDDVKKAAIGIIGVGEGAEITANIAALDGRVKAAVLLGNTGWHGYDLLYGEARGEQIGFFTDTRARFSYALSVESCAQFVAKPLLMVFASNATENDFDRAFDTFARLSHTLRSAMNITPRADGTLRSSQLDAIKAWFDANLRMTTEFATTPEIEVYASEGRLYARLTTRSREHIARAEVFYAYDQPDYRLRNWYNAELAQTDEGKWIAEIEVGTGYFYCFATITYENGVSVASRQIARKPADFSIRPTPVVPSRLLYDSAMGTDCFTCIHVSDESGGAVRMGTGPMGIEGVRAVGGEIATYKISDPRFSGREGDMLNITYYASEDQMLHFTLGVLRNGVWIDYSCERFTRAGEIWQKLTLSLKDFHDPVGRIPTGWSEVSRFSMCGGAEGIVLLDTVLWT